MSELFTRSLAIVVAVFVIVCSPQNSAANISAVHSSAPAGYGRLPLSFEVNQGQSDQQVKFLTRGRGYGLFLTPTEAVLSLRATDDRNKTPSVVRMRLVGANRGPQLAGLDPQTGKSNYFIGSDPGQWRRDVPNYARVKYAQVYPGIDLIYHGSQRQLEYDFVVAPGADPERITLAFKGVSKLSLDAEGNLVLATAHGNIVQKRPIVYQDVDGARRSIDGRYVLRGKRGVSFYVASYDTSHPLVIDPVMVYSTYHGGNGEDSGNAIAVDATGSAYVTGYTASTNFPTAGSPVQAANGGDYDAFVTKLNAAGTALVYSTYLGGAGMVSCCNGFDSGSGIAVDANGNAYITGTTESFNFPTANAFDATLSGGADAFVVKLNPTGALVYSTYLGGWSGESGHGIRVDASGSAYVTGNTTSGFSSSNFPTTAGAFKEGFGPGCCTPSANAFVTKLSPAGNTLVYSTLLGGLNFVDAQAIAIDGSGNAFVTGTTVAGFPTTSGSFQPVYPALNSAASLTVFVTKLNAAGTALVYSSYLGGVTPGPCESIDCGDFGRGVAVDGMGNAYVSGHTTSTNFPTTSSAFQVTHGGRIDAFVTKLNPAGSALVYSTYLGGTFDDYARAVAIDGSGNAYVTGYTSSTNFPTAAPFQAAHGGGTQNDFYDAFVAKLTPAGNALFYSTYLGGDGPDLGFGIAVDGAVNTYVTGRTRSGPYPGGGTNFPTANPIQATLAGGNVSIPDAFVTKFGPVTVMPFGPPSGLTATATSTSTASLTWIAVDGAAYYEVARRTSVNSAYVTIATPIVASFSDSGLNSGTTYLYVVRTVNAQGSPSTNSNTDAATTIMFDDDPIVVASTTVKAIHLNQLQAGVNTMQIAAGVPVTTFAPASNSTIIAAFAILQLRDALGNARQVIGLPPTTYTDATLTSGVTLIKAAHFEELRTGVN